MTQLEFYKSFQFVIELLIAEILFVAKLQRRSYFILRLIAGTALLFLFSFFFPVIPDNAFYVAFMFLVIFSASLCYVKFLFAETWFKVIFCCMAGYTVQHLAYELFNLINTAIGANANLPLGFYGDGPVSFFANPLSFVIYLCVYITCYFLSAFLFAKNVKKNKSLHLKNGFLFLFVIFLVIVDVFLNALVVYYVAAEGNTLYLVIVGIYNILCCGIALFLQFEVSLRKQIEASYETLKQLRYQEKEQYVISKENIELINMKCHDLKHQIRQIGNDGRVSSKTIGEIEKVISIYDSEVKTGNEALDIILTEKSLLCNKKGIQLSCIVDGKQLTFMDVTDVYALFGNLFENAIEAVSALEPEKRIINLKVKQNNSLVYINMRNGYEGTIEFEEGIPRTTKSDKNYHGYGMRSIRNICESYGGNMTFSVEDNIFSITLLFAKDQSGLFV